MKWSPPSTPSDLCLLGGRLGAGIGSEIRQPLGYKIVGDLSVLQLLTLFTTPVVYIYMDRLGHLVGRRRVTGAQALAGAPAGPVVRRIAEPPPADGGGLAGSPSGLRPGREGLKALTDLNCAGRIQLVHVHILEL